MDKSTHCDVECFLGQSCIKVFNWNAKLQLMGRVVVPQIDYRFSRWPPQRQIALEIDRMQRTMTATLLCSRFNGGESVEDFCRGRNRTCTQICRDHGHWSTRWFESAISWDKHLSRQRNSYCWAARLRSFRDREWCTRRRILYAPVDGQTSIYAGRTNTRNYHGKVHMRWHDGIHFVANL